MNSQTSKTTVSWNAMIVPFTLIFLSLILVVTVLFVSPLSSDHIYGDVPNGWYHQREHIQVTGEYSMIQGNYILFAMCNHDYLGPLHGSFKLTCNLTQNGWYDLYVRNNEIVAAEIYEVDTR